LLRFLSAEVQWLRTEIYRSPEILALVLGLRQRQSVHKTLMAMQEQTWRIFCLFNPCHLS